MTTYTGGCLCGRVRYSTDAAPVFSGVCHCHNCQRVTGSAFAPVLAFAKAGVHIAGELKSYQDTGDSGQPIFRRFCPNCGSSVVDEAAIMPDVLMILAGTLDDAALMQPTMEIFCASAQPWVNLAGERKRFARMPG
jgi:hypothetical protein